MNKLDIVSICETFLDGAILDSEVVPPGYTVYRCDQNRNGGGLLVAVTDSIPSVRRFDLEMPDIELIWVQIYCGSTSFLFGLSYRPPSSSDDYFSFLAASLRKIAPTYNVLLSGDFNLPLIDWSVSFPISIDSSSSRFCDILKDFSLCQMVKDATRGSHIWIFYSLMILTWYPFYSSMIIYLVLIMMQSSLLFLFYLQSKSLFTECYTVLILIILFSCLTFNCTMESGRL